jgi:hypothetical protein
MRFLYRYSRLWRLEQQAEITIGHHFAFVEWWRLNKAILERIRADCAAAGVPVLFVYMPTEKFELFPLLQEYMQQSHANLIDMTATGRWPAKGAFLPNGHPSAIAARYIADAISEWISSHLPQM